jgi:hypothetical protein
MLRAIEVNDLHKKFSSIIAELLLVTKQGRVLVRGGWCLLLVPVCTLEGYFGLISLTVNQHHHITPREIIVHKQA